MTDDYRADNPWLCYLDRLAAVESEVRHLRAVLRAAFLVGSAIALAGFWWR